MTAPSPPAMTDGDLLDLLDRLARQTRRGQRQWDEVPGADETFLTSFDAGALGVARRPLTVTGEHGEPVRCDHLRVRILTDAGAVVLERGFVGPAGYAGAGEAELGFRTAYDLRNGARETARGAGDLLNRILLELRGGPAPAVPARAAA